MGCCASEGDGEVDELQRSKSKSITSDLRQEKRAHEKIHKLLFLGSGNSGKTTVFKQLTSIHGPGFSKHDRNVYKSHIHFQVISQMRMLTEYWEEIKEEESEDSYTDIEYTKEGEQARDYMFNIGMDGDMTNEVGEKVDLLWKEKPVQKTFDQRAKLRIDDSSGYFFDEVKRISMSSYIPNDKDIMLVRQHTTGVVKQQLVINGHKFHIYDVGGQKSERNKWMHCFDNTTAVIFVASLSAYDELLYEDERTNCMLDALDLFENISNSKWFRKKPMILFLNKSDVYAIKIENIPLTICFPDYKGENEYKQGIDYIQEQFQSKRDFKYGSEIYPHIVCATDTRTIEKVFNDVQHVVVSNSLMKGGLV